MICTPHKSRKFDSQTIETSNAPGDRTSEVPQFKTDKADANDTDANMPDYFRSGINRTADRRASQVLMNKRHNEFSDFFFMQ